MKNLTRLAIVTGFVVLQGCVSSARSSLANLEPVKNSLSGSNNYEVHWNGSKGADLYAGYAIMYEDFNQPMKMESVQAKLPHKVKFSTPPNAIVSAHGITINKGDVEVKIYKNGSECGKVVVVGSGVGGNKVCE